MTSDGQPSASDNSNSTGASTGGRASSGKRKRKRGSRSLIRRMIYWCLVLALWGVLAAAGTIAWVASTLPAMQSLEVPKRPPKIEIVGLDGKTLTVRGEMVGADVSITELPPYLP